MRVRRFEFNPFPVNTFVLYDDTNECVVIDAGMLYDEENNILTSFIADNNLQIKHLLNTHLHFDHLLGNPFMWKKFGLKTKAHKGDMFLLERAKEQAAMFGVSMKDEEILVDKYIDENDIITFGNTTLRILHVPGHSPGSLVFYSEADKCLFAGDVLFRGSIGRTDLPGGDFEELIYGINQKLLSLPDDVIVYSGHGPSTTIEYEKKYNPFL